MKTNTLFLSTALAALLAIATPAMTAQEPIGAVMRHEPSSAIGIAATSGAVRPLPYQAAVYANDTVVTKDDGTQLRFTDQTLLAVSSNSKVTLDSFVFQKDTGTLSGRLTLGIGVFRLVTGALVKHDNLDMVTPVSVLSIRGTDFVVAVERDGTTLVRLYEGRLRIKTCTGAYIWIHAGQRITISPTCMVTLQTVGANGVVADAGNGSDGTGTSSGSGGVAGDPSGGPGGDPSGGIAGGNSGGGDDPSHDPGTGNGGPGNGNGGTSPGHGSDPGTGNGHGSGGGTANH